MGSRSRARSDIRPNRKRRNSKFLSNESTFLSKEFLTHFAVKRMVGESRSPPNSQRTLRKRKRDLSTAPEQAGAFLPVSANKNTPFILALAMQSSGRKCNPAPDCRSESSSSLRFSPDECFFTDTGITTCLRIPSPIRLLCLIWDRANPHTHNLTTNLFDKF